LTWLSSGPENLFGVPSFKMARFVEEVLSGCPRSSQEKKRMRMRLALGVLCLVWACAESVEPSAIDAEESALDSDIVSGETLRAAGATTRRKVGAAVDIDALSKDPTYASILAREFNAVTAENAMKWGVLQQTRGVWNFGPADALVRFAQQNKMVVRGHALVWHLQLPPFVNDSISADDLRNVMVAHINATAGHFAGKIYGWDVVNEAVDDTGGKMRESVLFKKLGESFIDLAFRTARAKDLNARLYYNDYATEIQNEKSDAVYALMKRLIARNVPIDGVGFQYHLDARTAPTVEQMVTNFKRFTALGLSVNISELDVRVKDVVGTQAQKLALQGRIYQRVAAACRQVTRCYGITSWGFTDKYSWIDSFFGADDPLQFDDAFAKKPAYEGQRLGLLGEAAPEEPIGAELLPNGGFENGLTGWTGSGAPFALTAEARSQTSAVKVTGRTETYHGVLTTPASGKSRQQVSRWFSRRRLSAPVCPTHMCESPARPLRMAG
jgi:endo-1,4-beta-xylanase